MSASVTTGSRSNFDRAAFGAIGALVGGLLFASAIGFLFRYVSAERSTPVQVEPRAPVPAPVSSQPTPNPANHDARLTTGTVMTFSGGGSGGGTSVPLGTPMISATGVTIGTHALSVGTSIGEGMLPATQAPAEPAVRPVPSVHPFVFDESGLAEYRAVATDVGAVPAELTIADFRTFLAAHKIPTFDLTKVVGYMDKIAATDNPDRYGWHWAPVRASDVRDINLGRSSVSYSCNGCVTSGSVIMTGQSWSSTQYTQRTPASDYYAASRTIYARTIPLHALQLIAQIEHQFGVGKVAFMVSDYTTEPDRIVTPDPFLMAVIPNDKLAAGEGRFIIDAWDEPGFGVGPTEKAVTP